MGPIADIFLTYCNNGIKKDGLIIMNLNDETNFQL